MGRNCGWLAIMAALATGADYMFIPERPPTAEDWQSSMCSVLDRVSLATQIFFSSIDPFLTVLAALPLSTAKKASARRLSSSLRAHTIAI